MKFIVVPPEERCTPEPNERWFISNSNKILSWMKFYVLIPEIEHAKTWHHT